MAFIKDDKDFKNDFTGVVGVKRAQMKLRDLRNNKNYLSNEFEGHFYTFVDKEGSEIAHSSGRKGLEERKTPNSFKIASYWYLRLKLPSERKL